jgi:hypothetical protein
MAPAVPVVAAGAEPESTERGFFMRLCGTPWRSLARWSLATAALLAFGVTAHAQIGGGSTSSGGFGGSGGSGGGSGGGSSGFGNNSNGQFSFAGGSGSSFSGSSGSGTFSGSSGSSFSGSSGSSFSGGSAFSGSSGSGSYGSSYGGGSGSGGMSITGGVSNMNAFASSYANPLAGGLSTSNGTTSQTYGTALYSTLMSNPTKIVGSTSGSSGGFIGSSGSGGMMGGRGMSGGYGASGSGSTTGTSQYGIFALPYSVASNERYPVPASVPQPGAVSGPAAVPGVAPARAALTPLPARVQTDLMGLIGRSDSISAATRSGLSLGYDAGGNVVLRGTVASPGEARALEGILRFAPGVSGVRNEMTLKGP